jgi:hypothetical protein
MEPQAKPHIVSADRLGSGLIITFDDGKCGLYSTDLLYAILPQAQEVSDSKFDDDIDGSNG